MAANTLTITEEASTATSDYPFQIARPFAEGEILNAPQVVVTGGAYSDDALTTQVDVKQRWPDGSVKHAVLTWHMDVAADTTYTVAFQDQGPPDNSGYLGISGMTSGSFSDFDAQMALTNGTTESASCRTMIVAGSFDYWLRGPVATSIIATDHVGALYDIGFDAYTPFRPIFHATFFPLTGQVRVRFIGEVASTEALEDVTYALALKTGFASPTTIYSKASRTHWAGTRWTKEFWIGGTPPTVSIDHNLAYLVDVPGAVPHYDITKTPSESALASAYSAWTSAAKDIGDGGTMEKAQNIGGDRDDLGLNPEWVVRWLYTGDHRAREEAFGNAELSASWAFHYREGDAAKTFDGASEPGIGRVMSIRDRPTMDTRDLSRGNAEDQVNVVGAMTDGGWNPSMAHSCNACSMAYAFSGDFFFLEELWFLASKEAAQIVYGPGAGYGRGPTGAEGVLWETQVRSNAWGMRDRCLAAFWAPDGTPEQDLWTALIDEAIADHEGRLNITGTAREGNAIWTWAKLVKYTTFCANMASTFQVNPGLGQSPLHLQWWGGTNQVGLPSQHGISDTLVANGRSPWMDHYFISAFGWAEQMGFDTGAILDFIAPATINQIVDPSAHTVPNADYNPWWICNYRRPGLMVGGGANNKHWAADWAEEDAAYVADTNVWSTWPPTDVTHLKSFGYAYLAYATTALAMLAGRTDGDVAWAWAASELLTHSFHTGAQRWAITPTTSTPGQPLPKLKTATYSVLTTPAAATKGLTYGVGTPPVQKALQYAIDYPTGTISEVGSAEAGDLGGSDITVNVSGLGIQEGDVVVAFIHANGYPNTITDNNGAYPFTEDLQADGYGDSNRYAVMHRVAGASEPGAYAWTHGFDMSWAVIVRVFRGVDPGDVWDVSPAGGSAGSGSSSTIQVPTITTTVDNALGIAFFLEDHDDTSFSAPTNGYGFEVEDGGINRGTATYTKELPTAGSVGAVQVTGTRNARWNGHHFALKPGPYFGTTNAQRPSQYAVTAVTIRQRTAAYAVVRTPAASALGLQYAMDVDDPIPPIVDEWFAGTLAAWTVGGADIVTVDNDEKLRLDAAGEFAYRTFTAPATGPLIVESDLRYSASGVQGYLEVMDSGGPMVLAAVRFTGGNAYASTDTESETSHAFAAAGYRQLILAFDQDAATVRFYISGANQGGRNGTWDLIAEKAYSGGTIDRVRLRTTTSGTVYADMVQVFVPNAFVMGDSIADGKPNWSEQPNFATDAGGAHGRLGPSEDETAAPAYQLGLLTGELVASRAFGAATSTQILNGVGSGEGLQGLFLDEHGRKLYLHVGHNDLYGASNLATLQANIGTIFETLIAGGIDPGDVTFCKIAPSDLFEGTPADDESNRIEYNRWLTDFCAQNRCRIAFNCEALNNNTKTSAYKRLNPAYDVGDGTHMTAAGAAVLAREMFRARVPGGVLRRTGAGLQPASFLTDSPAAAKARGLAYAVRPDTRRVADLTYVVQAPITVAKSSPYAVRTTPATTVRAAAYTARIPHALVKTAAYEALPEAGRLSRAAAYTVRATVSPDPVVQAYAVRATAPAAAKVLGYEIDTAVHGVMVRGMAYQVTATPALARSLAYVLGGAATGALQTVVVPPEAHETAAPPETHTVQVMA